MKKQPGYPILFEANGELKANGEFTNDVFTLFLRAVQPGPLVPLAVYSIDNQRLPHGRRLLRAGRALFLKSRREPKG